MIFRICFLKEKKRGFSWVLRKIAGDAGSDRGSINRMGTEERNPWKQRYGGWSIRPPRTDSHATNPLTNPPGGEQQAEENREIE